MAKNRKAVNGKNNTVTIVSAVVIALVVGLYFGVAVIPAVKDSSTEERVSRKGNGMSGRISEAKARVEQEPGSAALWAKLGDLYFDSGQHYEAIDAYKASLAIEPENSHVLTDLGVMYRRTDRPKLAVESFDKAIEASADNYTPYFNKGIVLYYDLHDKDAAIKSWQQLLDRNPNARTPSGKPLREMIQELS